MKTLVAGWFSFEQMGATAGDLMARDVACGWLDEVGKEYDVALAPPFEGGVDWRTLDPSAYRELVFVCGPFGNGEPLTQLLGHFADARLIGLNLTMLEPLVTWNPFELLIERDSSRTARPDLSFLSHTPSVPVVGLVLLDSQPGYGDRDLLEQANGALRRLAASNEVAAVSIDTRLDANTSGLRTPAEVESLIARMDLVLTTRLHGLVLALKNGVPAVAVDPVGGGGKITRQADTLGWPWAFGADVAEDKLATAFERCLAAEARSQARACAERAVRRLVGVRDAFLAALADRQRM